MKYLKITNTPEGLRVARALIGSFGFSFEFIGLHKSKTPFLLSKTGFVHDVECLIIPLENLKLCPYIAMREGLTINISTNHLPEKDTFDFCALKHKLNYIEYGRFVTETKLDLEWACSLDGIEVVDG